MVKFKPIPAAVAGTAALFGSTMLTAPAAAQTASELQAQIDALQAKLQQVESRQEQAAVAPAQAVEAGDKPRSIKWPGTATSFQVGGYAKGDFLYDINSQNGDSFSVGAIPRSDEAADEQEGHVRLHARQSRVWFKTWTPTEMGEFTTHIEGDFFGAGANELVSNSSAFRLRHAYGTLGGLLVGQTWTNFMTLHAYPDTVDFFGPIGQPFLRQAQIRYTFRPSDQIQASVSVENPDTDGRDLRGGGNVGFSETTGGNSGSAFDQVPDFTGRVQYSSEGMILSLAGVARWLTLDDGAAIDESEFGWGLHAAATFTLFGQDSLSVAAHGGDGVGRYMLDLFQSGIIVRDGVAPGSIETDTASKWGITGNYGHRWTSTLASWVHYSYVSFEDEADLGEDNWHKASGNVVWTPVAGTKLGLEVIWGRRVRADGDENNQVRIQAGAQWVF